MPESETPSSDSRPKPAPSNFSKGVRETIESIAITFALAFLFKTFQAEAFMIPTGSMAPTLMGRHKDVNCPACGFHYSASGSEETDRQGNLKLTPDGLIDEASQVVSCTCPVCRFPMSVDPQDPQAALHHADPSYNGDRIWVTKVPYEWMEPKRWEVIVFRFPEEAETYYIKRLVGLPGETIKLFHGDVYTQGPGESGFTICRKPPDKARAMAQVVHDNDYVSENLRQYGWPLRWQPWPGPGDSAWQISEDGKSYASDGKGDAWIRYQHVVPSPRQWRDIIDRRTQPSTPPPQLITDFYAFNSRVLRGDYGPPPWALGLHWVGDLMLECQMDIQGKEGAAVLELIKGGRHFRCQLDAATGKATLSIDDDPAFAATASTRIRPGGNHRIRFSNFDQQLLLWVDEEVVAFDRPTTYEAKGDDRPRADGADRGDLAPAGVASLGLTMKASHLRILRDLYYIADDGLSERSNFDGVISDYAGQSRVVPMMRSKDLVDFFSSPEQWDTSTGGHLFNDRRELVFPLAEDQFFVLGDNSPASADARLWTRHNFVERELLVGKALFVFWPHPWDVAVPFMDKSLRILPNFAKMGFIR